MGDIKDRERMATGVSCFRKANVNARCYTRCYMREKGGEEQWSMHARSEEELACTR